MNKKIVIGCIGIVFMLITISIVSSVGNKPIEKEQKISPLFGIRAQKIINKEESKEKIQNLKIKFIGERLFFLPFQWLRNTKDYSIRDHIEQKKFTVDSFTCVATGYCTCVPTSGCNHPSCRYNTCLLPTCNGVTCTGPFCDN